MSLSDQLSVTQPNLLLKLANSLRMQGQFELAYTKYQEIICLKPDCVLAYQQLADLLLQQRQLDTALEYYNQALGVDFEKTNLSNYYAFLSRQAQNHSTPTGGKYFTPTSNQWAIRQQSAGKINLGSQKVYSFHRSGWGYAIEGLQSLHNNAGVLFDGFIEDLFIFEHNGSSKRPIRILEKMKADGVLNYFELSSEERGLTPYRKPWVGFLHNPQNMPNWYHYDNSPQMLFKKEIWQESLKHCIGLFALSHYHADWIREQTRLPVSALIHPTEIPESKFDFERFKSNTHKKIVQIGWWLRKSTSLYQLPIAKENKLNYEKVRFSKNGSDNDNEWKAIQQYEIKMYNIQVEAEYWSNTRVLNYLSNDQYDLLLAENIAFLDLYDSSVNNAVIECIARGTPLLINPLPAVKEYLGDEYPMYFDNLAVAAEKAMDLSLIQETHQYLLNCQTRQKLSADYFLQSFKDSEVYRAI